MPKTIEVKLYEFNELSDKAKERAREWWRECEAQEFGQRLDFYETFEDVAKLLGITFKTHDVELMSGNKVQWPNIWWQLHIQGSGASFEGSYEHRKGCVDAIRKEFPQDEKLLSFAKGLSLQQQKFNYKLTAKITADTRFTHSNAMEIEAYDKDGNGVDEMWSQVFLRIFREFADWIYDYIEKEYEYQMSDETVDDNLQANEYTFRADGRRSDD